jgi:glycosyltransferase involved in cell wall biosynthesis
MGIDLARIRAALGRPSTVGSAPSIVVLGRLTAEKNLDMVVSAFREVRRRRPTASLTFVGSALPGDTVWKVPTGEGISHIDWLADPYPIIAGADLLVSGSRREGFSMAVAEALLLGIPVVAVTNRGARQIHRRENQRLTLVPNDITALTEAIMSSLALTKLGAVDESLASNWSTESAVRSHTDLIRKALVHSSTATAK